MMGYEYGDTHTTGSNSGWPTVAVIAVIVLTLPGFGRTASEISCSKISRGATSGELP
jgi:hypothetical protein